MQKNISLFNSPTELNGIFSYYFIIISNFMYKTIRFLTGLISLLIMFSCDGELVKIDYTVNQTLEVPAGVNKVSKSDVLDLKTSSDWRINYDRYAGLAKIKGITFKVKDFTGEPDMKFNGTIKMGPTPEKIVQDYNISMVGNSYLIEFIGEQANELTEYLEINSEIPIVFDGNLSKSSGCKVTFDVIVEMRVRFF
ncbi:MAG: hypothetical protein ACK4YE_04135 [Bacteroidota bacterium]|jgi:hypothetical protein